MLIAKIKNKNLCIGVKNDDESEFRKLKIRTIWFSYFNEDDTSLGADLDRHRREDRFDNLIMLYEKNKKP